MSNYYDQERAFSNDRGNSSSISARVMQLTGVAVFYRILKEWQSEFKPRLYERQLASTAIEKREVRLNSRRR